MRPEDIARRIEHSLLSATATEDEIRGLCAEAVEQSFYSVCVNPSRVGLARAVLKGSGVRVTTVAGFPLGAVTTRTKAVEALEAVYMGADEIDMVMDIGSALQGDWERVYKDIYDVRMALGSGAVLKVIIECCYLDAGQKAEAIESAVSAGADYVKTSTGMGPSGALADDVRLIKKTLKGRALIKAAGGIKTLSDLVSMVEAGADLIGTSSGVRIMREAG